MKRQNIRARFIGICLLLATPVLACAQYGQFGIPPNLPTKNGPTRVKKIADQYPVQPAEQPAFTIPLAPLGFSAPSSIYLLRKQSLVSLDFLDEDRLLFTFHLAGSGLMARDADAESSPHQVQAEVLTLPGGQITSKATWTVPDRSRYLWVLNDGHFLLRTAEGLDQGDAELKTSSYLRLPGRLLWIQMDPNQQILMSNSLEPASAAQTQGDSAAQTNDPPAVKPDEKAAGGDVLVVRTMKRETRDVMHVSQVAWTHQTNDWPMNSEGYIEKVQDKDKRWVLRFSPYSGGKGWVMKGGESTCPQNYSFLSEVEVLVTVCDPEGGFSLKGILTDGTTLWQQKLSWNAMWPLVLAAPNGTRVARQTLLLKQTINHYKRLVGAKDLQGQMVRVFDSADGKKVLEAPLVPMFDNGGNVAISPSGRRVAILNAGAIQVFQLPPPPTVPRPKPPAAQALTPKK